MLRSLKFSKPKGPGFGISRGYYLSVLSSKPVMPVLWDLINPGGEQGAIVGLGAPLMAGSTKDSLKEPMQRGAYALATKDRKTVVKLLVMGKEEAGFDPEVLVRSKMAESLSDEMKAGIRATWTISQSTFESHDPAVFPAIYFQFSLVRRLAELTDGVIADPLSQRYLFPQDVIQQGTSEAGVSVVDLVSVGTMDRPDGMHAFTRGMQKVGLPEVEIAGLDPGVADLAGSFLLSASQSILGGNLLVPGAMLGASGALFEAQVGGHDRAMWEGIPVIELLPPRNMTTTDTLETWASERRA